MPPRTVLVSPGMQQLLSVLPQTPAQQPDAGSDFGGIFKKALPFVAQNTVSGAMKALEALDLSRQWVAKPTLGALLYASDPSEFQRRYGDPTPGNLRRGWNEANIPGVIKFGAEMVFDPVNYIGLGLGKTTTARVAESLLPIVLRRGPLAAGKQAAKRTKLLAALETNPEASKAIRGLAAGAHVDPADVSAFARAAKVEGVPDEWITHMSKALQSNSPAALKAIRAGLFQRALPDSRMMRVLGAADSLADSMWATGMSVPGWAVSRIPVRGKHIVAAFNRAGEFAPFQKAHGLLATFGPEAIKIQNEMMKAGQWGTWLFGMSVKSAERDVFRTASGITASLKHNEAMTGRSIREVLSDAKFADGQLFDEVPLIHSADPSVAANEKRLMQEVISGMDDTEFLRWTGAIEDLTEEEFTTALARRLKGPRFAELGVLDDPAFTENVFDRAWGLVGKAVDAWRPLVTTLNPIAWPILQVGDNSLRGGLAFLSDQGELGAYMVKAGFPKEMAQAAAPSMHEILTDAARGAVQGLRRQGLGHGLSVEEVLAADAITAMGVDSRSWIAKIPIPIIRDYARAQLAITLKSDMGVMMQAAAEAGSTEWVRRILTEGPPEIVGALKMIDDSALNPSAKKWLRDHAPFMIDNPVKAAKTIAKQLNLDNVTMGAIQSSRPYQLLPEEARVIFLKKTQELIDRGVPVRVSMLQGLEQTRRQLPEFASAAMDVAQREIGHAETVLDDAFKAMGVFDAERLAPVPGVQKDLVGRIGEEVTAAKGAITAFPPAQIPENSSSFLLSDGKVIGGRDLSHIDIAGGEDLALQESGAIRVLLRKFPKETDVRELFIDLGGDITTKQRQSIMDMLSTADRVTIGRANLDPSLPPMARGATQKGGPGGEVVMDTPTPAGVNAALNSLGIGVVDTPTILTGGLKSRRLDQRRRIGELIEASKQVMETTTFLGPKDVRHFRQLKKGVPLASQRTDLLAHTMFSQAAGEADTLSANLLPVYENVQLNLTDQVADRMTGVANLMTKYSRALEEGSVPKANRILNRLSAAAGDFKALVPKTADDLLPTMDEVMGAYRGFSENVWYRMLGAKLELADGMVAMIQRKKWNPKDIASLARKIEMETFQTGNIAGARMQWAQKLADETGGVGQRISVRQMDRPQLLARQEELGTELKRIQGAVDDAGKPLTKPDDPQLVELQAELQVVTQQVDNPPDRALSEIFLEYQNHYAQIGKGMLQAVQKSMPDNYLTFMSKQVRDLQKMTASFALNEQQDLAGVELLKSLTDRLLNLGGDKRVQSESFRLFRESLAQRGMPAMRNLLVDYTRNNNVNRVLSSVIPFSSFQMHLPGYLGRALVHRPGHIAALNHFVQAAEDDGMFRGGMILGGGFMFSPQLRFSWLPLMAGQNFVRGEDSFQNQVSDIVGLFGFTPGPHVQIAQDLFTRFAEQANIPGFTGGEPEFRLGLVPQWRWIQNITALMGMNGGEGFNIPFLGASMDIRRREVEKELASRVAKALQAKKRQLGRDLYPDEVIAIRDEIHENQLATAKRVVAARDLAVSAVPGLKPYSEGRAQINQRVAAFLNSKGIEASPKDAFSRYRELSALDRAELFRTIPEFEDVLAVPPFQESAQNKENRVLRTRYFDTTKRLLAERQRSVRVLDGLLDNGEINIVEWRERRGEFRRTYAAQVEGLRADKALGPIIKQEDKFPSDPGESAWLRLNQLEPVDINGNGIIDDEDMANFFELRRLFLNSQSPSIRAYIQTRQGANLTNREQSFLQAQEAFDGYQQIPRWTGLPIALARIAQTTIDKVKFLARITPGEQNLTQLIMTMPGLSNEERQVALMALRLPDNPARAQWWAAHPLLQAFYPDKAPGQ